MHHHHEEGTPLQECGARKQKGAEKGRSSEHCPSRTVWTALRLMLLCFATDHEAEARQAYPQATQCAHLGGHPPAVARYGAWWAEARYLILKRASGCLLLTWMCADGDCGQKNEDRRARRRVRHHSRACDPPVGHQTLPVPFVLHSAAHAQSPTIQVASIKCQSQHADRTFHAPLHTQLPRRALAGSACVVLPNSALHWHANNSTAEQAQCQRTAWARPRSLPSQRTVSTSALHLPGPY